MVLDIPDTMLACQIVEYGKPYNVNRIPVPRDLKSYDVLVKVAVASFCHTDEMVRLGIFPIELPCTGSHEGAGKVAAVGSSVKSLQPGDRIIGSLINDVCGGAPGITRNGMFAEYAVVDSRTAAKVPDTVSFETAAPLACAGCTVWRGIHQTSLEPGQWLGLVGSGGGVGHIGIKFAKALGYKGIGIEARDEGIKLSEQAGADTTLDARKPELDLVDEVQKITGGDGVDATVNLSDAPSAARTACSITKKHGLIVQIAQPAEVSIPFTQIIFRDIRIHGSLISSPTEMQEMLNFVAHHKITVDTAVFEGLDQISNLVDLVHSGKLAGKAVIVIDPNLH